MAEETEKKFKRIMEKLYSSTSLKSPPRLFLSQKLEVLQVLVDFSILMFFTTPVR